MMAVAQSQCLIGNGRAGIAASRLAPGEHVRAINQAIALDRDMMQTISPKQRVMPMAVPKVLIM